MTVFKTFLKVLNKCKMPVILFTVILIFFAGFNMQTNEMSTSFVSSKLDILIINNDEEIGVTKNLIEYIKNNSNIIEVENTEEARNDALFYRDVNYIIYIPENYREDFLNGENPKIEVKSTGDYQASLAEMMLERYIKVANIYLVNTQVRALSDTQVSTQLDTQTNVQTSTQTEEELINKINETLSKETEIEITSKLDTSNLTKGAFYYNFANYSILAGAVYVICLILYSFNEEKIRKRTLISSMNYKKHNMQLLLSNGLFALVLWLFYVLLSFILVGSMMFTMHGLILIINSFIFSICALTIAFLIANLINNKNAINGIVNVVALGSSFLCGAFVPVEWLPNFVLKIAHILPSYWYIQTNEIVKTLEAINFETLKPVMVNMGVILLFSVGFIVLTNIISKRTNRDT